MAKRSFERQRDSNLSWDDCLWAVIGCIGWGVAFACFAALLTAGSD